MALDLTGIDNRNEFYATHYLAAVLEHDLKEVVERWTKAGAEGFKIAAPVGCLGQEVEHRPVVPEVERHLRAPVGHVGDHPLDLRGTCAQATA